MGVPDLFGDRWQKDEKKNRRDRPWKIKHESHFERYAESYEGEYRQRKERSRLLKASQVKVAKF